MKAYLVTTGVAFALVVVAHLARLLDEGAHLMKEPVFLATSLAALGVCAWAVVLFRKLARPGS